jgi:putative molybdenum carrier protein
VRVISGGQTGADQAGLRAAKQRGYATGGWVTKGCRTDAGPAPWLVLEYGCQEHRSEQYAPRTIANVRMADALIWVGNVSSPGGRLTLKTAAQHGIPQTFLPFPEVWRHDHTLLYAQSWIEWAWRTGVETLMIAGNRERTNPGIGAFTEQVLLHALDPARPGGQLPSGLPGVSG